MRERLGDRVDLAGRQAERRPDVADRVPDAVGLDHGHAGHPLAAERVEDPVIDLGAARGFHVDVDVGQRLAQWGEEALHDEPVPQRIDPRDPQ